MNRIVNTLSTRRANQKIVLDIVRKNVSVSAAFLAKTLNVPAGTIARVTTGLMEAKLIKPAKNNVEKKVGKPPVMLEINDKFASLIGVELNELVTRVLVVDFKGGILAEHFERTTRSSEKILSEQLPEIIQKTINRCGNKLPPVKWIGIGISGLLVPGSNIVALGFLPHGNDIALTISKKFNIPVSIENDANLAAVAEFSFGAGKNYRHIVSLLDRGWIGAGIIIDGKLYSGRNHAAGELCAGIHSQSYTGGNSKVSEFPFIESYGLERMIREIDFKDFVDSDFTSRDQLLQFIAGLAEKGNEKAKALMENEVNNFAVAIMRLNCLFDPEIIILQGDITATGAEMENRIICKIHEIYKKYISSFPLPEIRFSSLSQRTVTFGAVSQAIDKLTDNVI
jgi:predicted NBD/HSP70 family sugar kinase/predicted transcriptional regulator